MKKPLLMIVIVLSIFAVSWFVYEVRKENVLCIEEFLVDDSLYDERNLDYPYLVDWNHVDALSLKNGQSVIVGQAVFEGPNVPRPRELARSLFDSKMIETSTHLGSQLCLTEEENEPDTYRAYFVGSYKTCTNECREDTLNFIIDLDKTNGEIILTGN